MRKNKIRNRIDTLLTLLKKYSIEELNDLYRAKEVELEINSFSQKKTVKWSDKLKKKMIQQAKKKRIFPSKQKYLKGLLKEIEEFDYQVYIEEAISDAISIIEKTKIHRVNQSKLKLLLIEFFTYDKKVKVSGYDSHYSATNSIFQFSEKINATKFWKFIESNKFSNIAETLEIIDIDNEEYPQIFIEIYELRVFELMKQAFNSKQIKTKLKTEDLQKLNIKIGMHDCEHYLIY